MNVFTFILRRLPVLVVSCFIVALGGCSRPEPIVERVYEGTVLNVDDVELDDGYPLGVVGAPGQVFASKLSGRPNGLSIAVKVKDGATIEVHQRAEGNDINAGQDVRILQMSNGQLRVVPQAY